MIANPTSRNKQTNERTNERINRPIKMRRDARIVDGEIVRNNTTFARWKRWRRQRLSMSWQYVSGYRVLWVSIAILVLAATNPVNWQDNALLVRRKQYRATSGTTFYYNYLSSSSSSGRRVTNYFLFSIEETFEALVVSALQTSWSCRFGDRNIGGFCNIIGAYLYHIVTHAGHWYIAANAT